MKYPVCFRQNESCLFSWSFHCKPYGLFYSRYCYNFSPFIIPTIAMFAFATLTVTQVQPITTINGWCRGQSCLNQCSNSFPECLSWLIEAKAELSVKQIASLEGGTSLLQPGACKGLLSLGRIKNISRPRSSLQTSQCRTQKIHTLAYWVPSVQCLDWYY